MNFYLKFYIIKNIILFKLINSIHYKYNINLHYKKLIIVKNIIFHCNRKNNKK